MKIELTENAKRVLEKRYLKKDKNGTIAETVEDMFQRVARTIALAEKKFNPHISKAKLEKFTEEFYSVMCSLEFLPNSPTLSNAGRETQQLSACFVLPIEDSIESIFETIKNTAIIHKTGGGTGFDFSPIRHKGSRVRSTMGIASGPVSFISVFDAATEVIKQGGMRRGANMGILSVNHPDITSFIKCKEDNNSLTNFNISVSITNDFMRKALKGDCYSLIDPISKKEIKKANAKEIFNLISEMAHKNGEPGVIYIDKINKTNPIPHMGRISSTNPCGEQPLLPYESCNLGSINLSKMVSGKSINYNRLKEVITLAVRMLDNIIEVNEYPLPQIEKTTKLNRKIGLGVMGFADMLIKMGIPYNSKSALNKASEIMNFISKTSKSVSSELAKERGVFPSYKGSIYEKNNTPMRNATTTTIAPTGTLSIIAGCSSGIEPIFGVAFIRNVLDNEKLLDINPLFEKTAKERGFYSKELLNQIFETGNLKDIKTIPQDVKDIFVNASEITPEWHIKIQSEFQKFTDNAVSKTINFPHDATKEQVSSALILAYKLGCKGITIYRDRSREKQVLTKIIKESEKDLKKIPRPRPIVIHGSTEKISTGCGNLYITINYDNNGPFELFARLGKTGGCAASQTEAISRLISLALRSNIDVNAIVKQLSGIRCPSPVWQNGELILSCPDAISKAIKNFLGFVNPNLSPMSSKTVEDKQNNASDFKFTLNPPGSAGTCPDCGSSLFLESGCIVCLNCGFSKCE